MEPRLTQLPARIDPRRIAFVKFILEGYDNLVQFSTLDRTSGAMVFRFHPSRRETLLPLLDELGVEIRSELRMTHPINKLRFYFK